MSCVEVVSRGPAGRGVELRVSSCCRGKEVSSPVEGSRGESRGVEGVEGVELAWGVERVSNFGVEVTESVSRFRGVEEVVEVSCVEARFQASGYFCRCMCGCLWPRKS